MLISSFRNHFLKIRIISCKFECLSFEMEVEVEDQPAGRSNLFADIRYFLINSTSDQVNTLQQTNMQIFTFFQFSNLFKYQRWNNN